MARANLTDSEKKMLVKIKAYVGNFQGQYDFCFVRDEYGRAVGWEGGYELGQSGHFRNQFTIEPHKQVKRNW